MRPFENETTEGNERAIKRGRHVPEGAINLAWSKAPELTPENNIIMLDTARIVPENAEQDRFGRKLMYSNAVGILEDDLGNQIVDEEYPYVSDVFTVDEDFIALPGSEYTPESILPFVHVSRYFHVDFTALTLGTALQTYHSEKIKVVDSNGKEYTDSDGNPRYRITITPAYLASAAPSEFQGAYRIYAFVDEITNEDLYLKYNKVELDINGNMKNQDISHREILNPQPYFQYIPEEADVVDPANHQHKIYSTKPRHVKQAGVDLTRNDADGYRIYVPRKAIPDPRLFQLFRWRVNCNFTQTYKTDPIKNIESIKCGVVRTTELKSICPYSFLNLWKSQWNISGVNFINPLKTPSHLAEKEEAEYWEVNFDTVTFDELKQFDILIWSPSIMWFDFGPYLNKIRYFTETVGGTLVIDTANYSAPANLGMINTSPTDPFTGTPVNSEPSDLTVYALDSEMDEDHELFDGNDQLGGWDFNDDDEHFNFESFSLYTTEHSQFYESLIQYIRVVPSDYDILVTAPLSSNLATPIAKAQVIIKEMDSGGNIIFGCNGFLISSNMIFSAESGYLLNINRGTSRATTRGYYNHINSYVVQGAYKFLYNLCMLAVKGKLLDSSDETSFSSVWSKPSQWHASWVINANNEILSDAEKSKHGFALLPKGPPDDPDPVWQRKLSPQTLKELIYQELTAADIKRLAGATRTYTIEITNPQVHVQTEGLTDNDLPYAWTEAYTPPFEVPVELGPHAVREEAIAGEYQAGQFIQREYPGKPYQVQVQATFVQTSDILTTQAINWAATGRATKHINVPPQSVTTTRDTTLSWREFGDGTIYSGTDWQYEFGTITPRGVSTWQNSNYWTSAWGPGNLNWPYFGFNMRLASGSSGEAVEFLQFCLNAMHARGYINTGVGYLAQDGYYGSATTTAVYAMQGTFNARYYDGVVDAESWSIVGNQMLRAMAFGGLTVNPNDISRFLFNIQAFMNRQHISDGTESSYSKRSWVEDGPSIIWEMFGMVFNEAHNIHGVTVVPHLTGAANTLMFRSIHITNLAGWWELGGMFVNYDSRWGQAIWMPFRPASGEHCYVPIGPYYGNTLVVGIGQDQGSGWGTARELGIKDIVAHAVTNVTTTTPGRVEETVIPMWAAGSARCKSNVDVIQRATFDYRGEGWLTDRVWEEVHDDNPDVASGIYPDGTVVLRNNIVGNDISGEHFTFGEVLPGEDEFIYYAMTTDQKLLPGHETGFVSKSEGIKLLCDEDRNPVGFPDLPTDIDDAELNSQRHYGVFTLTSTKSDHSVVYGFYDARAKELITNSKGRPEISFLEYMTRGPENIYIAVYSTFEVLRHEKFPPADDAPVIPFRWAMPVYGVCFRSTSRIGLEPLPSNLDITDVWPVPIRIGKFWRTIQIRPRVKNPLTTYIKNYEDTVVRAFYALPEVWNGAWSHLYGRPYTDVLAEHPLLEDDNVLKVRQAPILMVKEPAIQSSSADPIRPVFKVWTRETVDAPWEEMSLENIEDYNVSSGLIYLNEPLTTVDPALVKIDYTSARRTYYFKQIQGDRINLNPYLPSTKDFLNKSIYIYILPRYVLDKDGNVIEDSVLGKTIHWTLSPDIFNPRDPDYDPMAIQLGIIHITSNLDIQKLVMLDTRTRGGGAKEGMNLADISKYINDAKGYWDMGRGVGDTYQKSGFVVIRLPEELKEQFPQANDVRKLIRRNLTAGVEFKLETLEGEDW